MKVTKVGINGFGRIGRNILRALIESGRDDIQVVAVNDLAPVSMQAHLFRNDSVHGRFAGEVTHGDDWLNVGTGRIRCTSERSPENLPWNDVDIALECTGLFTHRDKAAKHLENGSKRVLISAPGKEVDSTVVFGVNHNTLTAEDRIVSNASCTTNCLAPVASVLHKAVGIEKGYMTTIHSYTGDQPTLDAAHSDPYRARAAALSMIPTSTGAAKAVGLVLPELAGKLDGSAIRVPTPNVSVVDLTFTAARKVDAAEINAVLQSAAAGPLQNVLAVSSDPLVSIDFNHDPHSSTVASDETTVIGDNLVRVLSWYDNEWGFSNRMLDTCAHMGALASAPQASKSREPEPA
ncbi:MAG: type I glyceraldehyde-3-phosphate dehydrogenase [Gammaproteobacteria bacterium]|nr:type I glyceraldehyde-3-phosphate dehydrogenase [Gammaproteobacteria bacterium]